MTKTAKKANHENPVKIAERTLCELQTKHDAVAAARAEDDREMGRVSLAAHSGDAEASKRLDTVVERMLRRDLELKSITSAITQAQHNLADAKAEEARAGERRSMTEVRQLAKVLREAGKKADDALAVLSEAADELADVVTAINRLGVTHPSSLQLMSLGERAVKSALIGHPWARGFEHLPPKERRTFASFVNPWAHALEQAVEAKLKHHQEVA